MTAFYFKCDGSASASLIDPSALLCSTGFVQVDEPVYTLVTREQADALILAAMGFWAVCFVIRELCRLIR